MLDSTNGICDWSSWNRILANRPDGLPWPYRRVGGLLRRDFRPEQAQRLAHEAFRLLVPDEFGDEVAAPVMGQACCSAAEGER